MEKTLLEGCEPERGLDVRCHCTTSYLGLTPLIQGLNISADTHKVSASGNNIH